MLTAWIRLGWASQMAAGYETERLSEQQLLECCSLHKQQGSRREELQKEFVLRALNFSVTKCPEHYNGKKTGHAQCVTCGLISER